MGYSAIATEKRRRGIITLLCFICILVGLRSNAWCRMEALPDAEMAAVVAQSGVSIVLANVQFDWAAGHVTIYDTDSDRSSDADAGSISFEGITLLNGVVETLSAITLDVYTIDDSSNPLDGQTFTVWESPDLFQYLNFTIDDLIFCGQSLGQIEIDNYTTPQQYWLTGAHTSGMDFEAGLEMHIDSLSYLFNSDDNAFDLTGIHLAGSFDDMDDFDSTDSTTWDIPPDPSEWSCSGVFSIGDVNGGNPATLDIGTDSGGQTVVQLELPMSGSIRVENLTFGGNDFGPMAIDGIEVHRLTVTLTP